MYKPGSATVQPEGQPISPFWTAITLPQSRGEQSASRSYRLSANLKTQNNFFQLQTQPKSNVKSLLLRKSLPQILAVVPQFNSEVCPDGFAGPKMTIKIYFRTVSFQSRLSIYDCSQELHFLRSLVKNKYMKKL